MSVTLQLNHVELNVSNSNFMGLFEALDIPCDYCGEIRIGDLIAKCRRYLMRGQTDVGLGPKTTGNFTDFGRREGYFDEKVDIILKALDREYVDRDAYVTWS